MRSPRDVTPQPLPQKDARSSDSCTLEALRIDLVSLLLLSYAHAKVLIKSIKSKINFHFSYPLTVCMNRKYINVVHASITASMHTTDPIRFSVGVQCPISNGGCFGYYIILPGSALVLPWHAHYQPTSKWLLYLQIRAPDINFKQIAEHNNNDEWYAQKCYITCLEGCLMPMRAPQFEMPQKGEAFSSKHRN